MRAHSGIRRVLGLLALLPALAASACGPSAPAPAGAVASYEMRGEIVRLPLAGSREIAIRHEAVPGFRDESDKVVGMDAMTMPFSLAQGLSVDGLAPGDRVSFTLEMRWHDPREIARVSRLEKLPPGTTLAWESPTLPGSSP
jgi:Cu/Ag efflux protein CusF